ncbi:transporter substrate-binding domain-containing protein [Ligilactobacillus salivarius]
MVILISAPTHISADTLKVGILADNKPYSYLTNKKVTGFEVELSKKIAQEMDANIKFVKVSDRKKLQKLVSEHQIDLALGQFDKTTLSSKLITTDTYLYPQNVLFTGTHRHISSIEDLQNKKVGILVNGNQHQLLTSLQMKPKVYNSISSLMKALENKK